MTLFIHEFEHLLTTLDAIEYFNSQIFTWAIQGELLQQDPVDEPANSLLLKIRSDLRDNEVKQKEYKQKFQIVFPSDIPSSWVLTKLSEIGSVSPRNKANDEATASFIPMRMIPDTYGINVEQEARQWGKIRKGYTHFQNNDVVVAKITPSFENGKSVVMSDLINGIGAGTTELHVFRGNPKYILPSYVWIFFKSSWFLSEGTSRMTGTAGQKRVPKEFVKDIPFPLPPFAEQKRIVEKVNSLLVQTAEIKKRLIEVQDQKRKLNQSALFHLRSAKKKDGFNKHWIFIKDNFDLLYDHPNNVVELKQSILQLAVQGKLTPQDPGDVSASVLLERIKAEKAQLVKDGMIKKSKPLLEIGESEIPYELPSGWEWARINDLVLKIGSGSTPKGGRKVYQEKGIKFIRSQNVWNDGLQLDNVAYISSEINDRMSGSIVQAKDVLLNITGASIARSAVVPDTFDLGNVNQHVAIIRLIDKEYRNFLHLYLISPVVYNMIMDVQVGVSREGLSMTRFKEFVVPIPPPHEQKQIVKKVEKIVGLCNKLEAGLVNARMAHKDLVPAVLGFENAEYSHV